MPEKEGGEAYEKGGEIGETLQVEINPIIIIYVSR